MKLSGFGSKLVKEQTNNIYTLKLIFYSITNCWHLYFLCFESSRYFTGDMKNLFLIKNKFLFVVKSFVVIICMAMFLVLMEDVWNKFQSKLINTGVQFRSEMMTKKQLPHLTICPWPHFKSKGLRLLLIHQI